MREISQRIVQIALTFEECNIAVGNELVRLIEVTVVPLGGVDEKCTRVHFHKAQFSDTYCG